MRIENLSISYLHQAYRDGSLTPGALVTQLQADAEKYLDKNIWIERFSFAKVSEYLTNLLEKSMDDCPLWGVPFVIKDNIDLAGTPTTAACEAFAYAPDSNAFVVEQLIQAGAIPLGKTNMDQFATGLVGVRSPEKWGACKNAFNDDYISGGSSSGSAVAVALGLASFSLGTDTAGSGRVPAAFNNIIGLKPSRGLLSCSGVVPACKSLDCVSIFATTADDANSVLSVAASFDAEDAYARKNPETNSKNYGRYAKAFRFAVPLADQLHFFENTSAQQLFTQAVGELEKLGGEKVEVDCSAFFDAANLLYSGPWVAERYVATEAIFTANPEAMLPVIQTIIGSQTSATAADAFKAFYQLQAYKQITDRLFEDVDVLLTPTTGTIYTQAELAEEPIKLNSNLGYYTNFMNLLDYSSIAVPAGFLDSGLPFGITFVGKAFDDTKLLSLANLWQSNRNEKLGATDWTCPALAENNTGVMDTIDVVVCGAHLEGLPLNWQLLDREAQLMEKTLTAASYRFYALAGGPPFRPGLIRDDANGSAIEVEVWRLNSKTFGSFVAGIPQPLGIGKVELADGRWVPSFICEGYAIDDAEEITQFGSWRSFMADK